MQKNYFINFLKKHNKSTNGPSRTKITTDTHSDVDDIDDDDEALVHTNRKCCFKQAHNAANETLEFALTDTHSTLSFEKCT